MQRHRSQGLGPREGSPPVRQRRQRLTRLVQEDPRVLPAEEPVVVVANQLNSPPERRDPRGSPQQLGTRLHSDRSPRRLEIVLGSRVGMIGTAAHMRGLEDPGSVPGLSRLSGRRQRHWSLRDHRRLVLVGRMKRQRHRSGPRGQRFPMNHRGTSQDDRKQPDSTWGTHIQ